MWSLLLTTILTSAADSLNPFAITQQFVLQGMVKKPKDILYFILPTGITNFIGGVLAYYGLGALIGSLFSGFIEQYGRLLFTAELILGVVCLAAAGYLLSNNKIKGLEKEIQIMKNGKDEEEKRDKMEAANKIKSVSPPALILLGIGATLSELTTALPYFAFLTILFNYQLSLIQVLLILFIYNFIYTLPLILLFLVYIKAQHHFDRLYKVIKVQMTKWSNILAPVLAVALGAVLMYHGMSQLMV